jgi:hypothetical protein
MFANSDIIYPSGYGARFTENMTHHKVGYAVGSRYNLTEAETKALRPAASYGDKDNFDFLDEGWKFVGQQPGTIWFTCGPWVIRRDVARAIGGFDPKVLVSEDDDLSSRAVHYLARQGEQNSSHCFIEQVGYHLYHPSSELFDWYFEAHQIIDARRDRLRAMPQSLEDIASNDLDDLPGLIEMMRRTPKPKAFKRYREDTIRKVGKRLLLAGKVLIGKR